MRSSGATGVTASEFLTLVIMCVFAVREIGTFLPRCPWREIGTSHHAFISTNNCTGWPSVTYRDTLGLTTVLQATGITPHSCLLR